MRYDMKKYSRILSLFAFFLCIFLPLFLSDGAVAQINPNKPDCDSKDPICNVCVDNRPEFTPKNPGEALVTSIFSIVNGILDTMERSFYGGIINNPTFQEIIGVSFIMYIAFYGVMILFNLATHR